jgi:drug/metabolite transporter (DMT)-like permease
LNATPGSAPARPSSWLISAKLVAVAALWGGTFIAGRVAATAMPPLDAAVGRFWIASVGLLVAAWLLEGGLPRLTRAQALGTLAMGAAGIYVYNVAFFAALHDLPAGRTSLLVSLNPVFTLTGAFLFLGERLSPIRLAGIGLALAGVAIVISRGDLAALVGTGIGPGERTMLIAVAAWATYTLIGRVVFRTLSPIAAATYAALWGTALLTLHAAVEGHSVPLQALGPAQLAALAYIGLLGTVVAFIWYGEGVQAIGAARAAVFTNLVPVFGVIQAAVLLGEAIVPSMVIGGAIAITGVMLANKPGP